MTPDGRSEVHVRRINSGALLVCSAQYCLRRFFFRIFPVAVFGRASTNSMECGHLKWARRERQNSSNSDSLSWDSGFLTTSPFGTSPHFFMGAGDPGSLINVRMCEEIFFSLKGRIFFPATHDDVFPAV